MRIINLTQHAASPEQIAAGVVEPADKTAVQALLTFDAVPTRSEIISRVRKLCEMASGFDAAMIGGAGYLVTRLENGLEQLGIAPLHAFSVRESMESAQPDGSVKKTMVFRHAGFVGIPERATVKTVEYNDGLKPRGHRDWLFVGIGDRVFRFAGDHILGCVAVAAKNYQKNGKWSFTDYSLRLAPGAWSFLSSQDWESGERFHGAQSPADIVAEFRAAGCAAMDDNILAVVAHNAPKTMARVVATASVLASVVV